MTAIDESLLAPSAAHTAPAPATRDEPLTVWDGADETGFASPEALISSLGYWGEVDDVIVLRSRTVLGHAVLTINPDGTWAVSEPMPERCNLLEDDGRRFDTLTAAEIMLADPAEHTLAHRVAEIIEVDGKPDEPAGVDITYWHQGPPKAFRIGITEADVPADWREEYEA